jgi:hypothetical protein
LKVRESLMYPESVSNDGRQDNEFAAAHAREAATRRFAASRFIPAFARRRPIRAALLAAAMFAIPYSLARHQGDVNAQRPNPASVAPPGLSTLPFGPVAMENVPGNGSSSPWHPPIGMDRRNETLDQLTLDFSSGHQAPSGHQTPNQPARFPAGRQAVALPGDGSHTPAPKPEAPVAAAPVVAPAALPEVADHNKADHNKEVADHNKKEGSDHKGPEHKMAARDVTSHDVAPPSTATAERPADDVDQYLWKVYERSTTKRDASGDFTWKDEAAAARLGLVTKQYVIEGMDPDFRELLYNLGHAMDAAGLNWTILSGFRDDYRQGLASGYKAHVGNSFHGGSRATGGYGHGCAADIEASDGEAGDNSAIWRFVDQHGEKFGIFRPMKGIDPAHVQPSGDWHDVAFNLRKDDQNSFLPASVENGDGGKVTPLVDTRSGVSEAQFDCVRSHHHADFRMAGLAHHHGFMHRSMVFHSGRMHRFGRRRMVVDASARDRRASLETVDGQAGPVVEKHVKAEASGNNRRDARSGKQASANAERTHWDARLDAKGPDAKGPTDSRHADDRHGQKRGVVESSAHQAKAKSHVAARADGSDKNDKL